MNEFSNLRSDDGSLGAAKAGHDNYGISEIGILHDSNRPSHRQVEVPGGDGNAKSVLHVEDILQRYLWIDDLCSYRFRGAIDLFLNAAVLRTAGELGNANHFKPSKKVLIFCTNTFASSSFVG